MASSSCVESESASGFGVSRTMYTGRRAGGVEECWQRLASATLLFREWVPLFLGAEGGVLLMSERGLLLLCCRMSVFKTSTNLSTDEACLLCSSLLSVERVHSQSCLESSLLTCHLWMIAIKERTSVSYLWQNVCTQHKPEMNCYTQTACTLFDIWQYLSQII